MSPYTVVAGVLIVVAVVRYFSAARENDRRVAAAKARYAEEAKQQAPAKPLREYRASELAPFDGTGDDRRILVGVKERVFEMTGKGDGFYGPDGPYNCFAGRDASIMLGRGSTDPLSAEEATAYYRDVLDSKQVSALEAWEAKFLEKYPVVGVLVRDEAR